MKMNPELFEQSLNSLKKGSSVKTESLKVPEQLKTELEALLETSKLLMSMPKASAPSPSIRRKYAILPIEKFWFSIFHVSRFVAGSAMMILFFAIFGLGGYKALQSMPGQPLFSVKRTAESVRLKFQINEAAKAELQLAYTQNRLNEARTILNNPQRSKHQEIAALEELSKQTITATQSVQQAARNKPLATANHPLVDKLESLANEQSELIESTTQGDAEVKTAAGNATLALNSAREEAGQIKKYLTIAESSQDPIALVDLSSDPDSVSVSGLIQKNTSNSLTVEKINFEITPETEIKDLQGKKIALDTLENQVKVKVNGKKVEGKIIAQSVVLLTENEEENVKGVGTTTPESALPKEETSTTPDSILLTPAEAPVDTAEQKPHLGNFIIENPNPQYSP